MGVEEKLYSVTRPAYTHENEAPTYHIKIGRDPSCSCPYSQKTTNICKHRLWVMLFMFDIPEDSYLLQQKAFTPTEVKEVFHFCKSDKRPPSSDQDASNQQTVTSTAQNLDDESEQIFRRHPHSRNSQEWKLGVYNKRRGRNPVCAGCCSKQIESLEIVVTGLYIPLNTKFCVPRNYHFCVDVNCIFRKPLGSNLSPPAFVGVDSSVSSTDVELAIAGGIPIH